MYQNPLTLPQFSNREDLLLTIGISDDNTLAPINLTNFATATGQAFTGASWTVKDGAISTPSTSSITIPALPYTGQLLALALTVGTGLGILPGDPVTISDPTGLNTMAGYVVSYASGTGALVCQIGISFQFEIRSMNKQGFLSDGYAPWYDFGTAPNEQPIIQAALGTGLSVIDVGMLQLLIPEATMRTLHHRTYLASLTMTDSVNTRQIFAAQLPMLYGGVSV